VAQELQVLGRIAVQPKEAGHVALHQAGKAAPASATTQTPGPVGGCPKRSNPPESRLGKAFHLAEEARRVGHFRSRFSILGQAS
jgi:hypothetical protein